MNPTKWPHHLSRLLRAGLFAAFAWGNANAVVAGSEDLLRDVGYAATPIDVTSPLFSGLSESELELLREYRDLYNNILLFYNDTSLTATVSEFSSETDRNTATGIPAPLSNGERLVRENRLVYHSSGRSEYRLDAILTNYRSNGTPFPPDVTVGIVRPDAQFLLVEDNANHTHYVRTKAQNFHRACEILQNDSIHCLPFSLYLGGPLRDTLFRQADYYPESVETRIHSVHLEADGKVEIAVVTWKLKEHQSTRDIEFRFDRSNGWALLSALETAEGTMSDGTYIERLTTYIYQYEGNELDVPLFRGCEIAYYMRLSTDALTGGELSDSPPFRRVVVDVTDISPGGGQDPAIYDEKVFVGTGAESMLATNKTAPRGLFWLLMINLSAALFVVGVLLIRKSRSLARGRRK